MNENPIIELGPILGLEGDNNYSLIFISRTSIAKIELFLRLSDHIKVKNIDCSLVKKLYSTYIYRFTFSVDVLDYSYPINYSIILNGHALLMNKFKCIDWRFVVPGKSIIPKVGFTSCNGDSKRYPTELLDDEFIMWDKMIQEHNKDGINFSFHCLIMGGDQVYADTIWDKVEFFKDNNLLGKRSNENISNKKLNSLQREELKKQVQIFYEDLYIDSWNRLSMSQAMASIPTIMMWDDHDIFDGWGSQPVELQRSDIFQLIFSVAKKYFELLQIRSSQNKALIDNKNNHYLSKLNFRNYEIIVLDNRSNRTNKQIMSPGQYSDIKSILNDNLFANVTEKIEDQKVVLFVVPVPVAHLNYKQRAEKWLKSFSKNNFLHSMNDDGLDHWDHEEHCIEQKLLIDLMYEFGLKFEPKYIHIISGDVHSAGSGRITQTLPSGKRLIINQLISSAIVYKPVGWVSQKILNLVSNSKSIIKPYEVRIDTFGFGKFPPTTIYSRNYGYLFKAKRGLKAYLKLESSKNKYVYDQPSSFRREKVE